MVATRKRTRKTAEETPTRLLVGLGNPGHRYEGTRHNVGFRVIDEVARRRGSAPDRVECNSLIALGDPILAKPQTYMNRSGFAVRCLSERYGVAAENCLVIYDDVHLPLGRLRLRTAGSPGGHRGMESVINNVRTEGIPRLRLGVGRLDGAPEGEDLVDYVLEPFEVEERHDAESLILRAADACEAWLEEEPQQVMNRFNG